MRFAPVFWFILLSACSLPQKELSEQREASWQWNLPSNFDSLPPVPSGNAMSHSRVELGRALFFDKRLSADGNVSCASCHKPALAYADTVALSPGVHERLGARNSPSLLNVAYQRALFREGGIPSLELQVIAPLSTSDEMDINLKQVHALLGADSLYQTAARNAYNSDFNPLVMAQALAAFQRSLISNGGPYDAFMAGDPTALSPAALRGMDLFYSEKLACSSCHKGFLFTDMDYYNTGLYEQYQDEGRGRLTMRAEDMGKMKTPSLRNVAITWPYMHDGSLATLEEVLKHYNQGGKAHPNKDSRIRPLELSVGELSDLKSFLISLTDESLY